MGLQLATGTVTVLLAEDVVRRRLMAMLEDTAGSVRLTAEPDDALGVRLDRVRAASDARLVIVDRLTDGLDAAMRRRVLQELRAIARATHAPAVLVDDDDGVAALAVADRVLRVDPRRGLVVEAPDGPTGFPEVDYRAS